jgi:hypothetical protein
MLEQIRQQLTVWFDARRQIDINTQGLLVSKVAIQIRDLLTTNARCYRLISVNGDMYEVFSPETVCNYIVQKATMTCTCYEWQNMRIPCGHALAVSLRLNEDPQTYARSFFRLDSYRSTYANIIFPSNADIANTTPSFIPLNNNDDDNESNNTDDDNIILPSKTRRAPGRPKKRRIRGVVEGGDRATCVFRCSRCGESGHSRRTCTRPVWRMQRR